MDGWRLTEQELPHTVVWPEVPPGLLTVPPAPYLCNRNESRWSTSCGYFSNMTTTETSRTSGVCVRSIYNTHFVVSMSDIRHFELLNDRHVYLLLVRPLCYTGPRRAAGWTCNRHRRMETQEHTVASFTLKGDNCGDYFFESHDKLEKLIHMWSAHLGQWSSGLRSSSRSQRLPPY